MSVMHHPPLVDQKHIIKRGKVADACVNFGFGGWSGGGGGHVEGGVCVFVCVCVSVWEEEGGGRGCAG